MSESGDDDKDQLETVHLLTTQDICEGSEAELSKNSSRRSGDFDSSVLGDMQFAAVAVLVDNTQHDGQERGSENIVLICEETNTSHNNGSDMIPAKGSLVDLCKSKSAALIGVLDMGEVIVEVVEGNVATSGGAVRSDFSHCIGLVGGCCPWE